MEPPAILNKPAQQMANKKHLLCKAQLVLCPYQAGEQPAHLRDCQGDQFFIRTVAAPFSPCSIA